MGRLARITSTVVITLCVREQLPRLLCVQKQPEKLLLTLYMYEGIQREEPLLDPQEQPLLKLCVKKQRVQPVLLLRDLDDRTIRESQIVSRNSAHGFIVPASKTEQLGNCFLLFFMSGR